jgi:maleate cis-trans isomerase
MERFERTRIGIITPDDAVNDDEYWEYVNADVTLLIDRYRTPHRYEPISTEMVASYGDLDLLADCAETLRITRPHALAFFCNSCSFVRGPGADLEMCRRMQEAGGAPATTTTTAQVDALRALGARRVAIGAPYRSEVTDRLRLFLERSGFAVTAVKSLELVAEWDIGNAAPEVWRGLARAADTPDSDCVLLACTGIRTAPFIAELEAELGKPVVSAPAATIWRALRLAGYSTPVRGRGVLLDRY